jgi:hypothetical protein
MSIRIYSPEGVAVPPPHVAAEPMPALSGCRIGLLDNGKPNAALLLTALADRVAARTGARVEIVTEKSTAATPAPPGVLEELANRVDVVLTGSAD